MDLLFCGYHNHFMKPDRALACRIAMYLHTNSRTPICSWCKCLHKDRSMHTTEHIIIHQILHNIIAIPWLSLPVVGTCRKRTHMYMYSWCERLAKGLTVHVTEHAVGNGQRICLQYTLKKQYLNCNTTEHIPNVLWLYTSNLALHGFKVDSPVAP